MSLQPPRTHGRLRHQTRVSLLALALSLSGAGTALAIVWLGDWSLKVQLTFSLVLVALHGWWLHALRAAVVGPLRGLANLLAALGEGDFTLRARRADPQDVLGLVLVEANQVADQLRAQRLGAVETQTLLRKVVGELDLPVFAWSADGRLNLINGAGERLLGRPASELLGAAAAELGLERCLRAESGEILELAFPGGAGRWESRRARFRSGGRSSTLLLLSDLTPALREEERQAWQRLVQVLRHEINNSLAPLQSLAETLQHKLAQRPEGWEGDVEEGLQLIHGRSRSLSRFLESYSRLTRLPEPELVPVEVAALVHRVAGLEVRERLAVEEGPPLTILGDLGQLEQLLLNLIGNAVDAARETGGGVSLRWSEESSTGRHARIEVLDEGPGLGGTDNLFVPFFTTKAEGTGIGLVLSRRIAESHGGSLSLEDRSDRSGCRAVLRLPLA